MTGIVGVSNSRDGVIDRSQALGSTDSPTFAAPALGTPSSGVVTNLSGVLPAAVTGGSGLTALGTVTSGNLSNSAIVYPAGMAREVYFGSTDTEVAWSSGDTTAVSVSCATGRGSGDESKFLIQGVVRIQTTAGTAVDISVYRGTTAIWNGGTTVWDASSNPNGVALPVNYLNNESGLYGTIVYYIKINRVSGSGAIAINYDDGTHDQKSTISVTEFKR